MSEIVLIPLADLFVHPKNARLKDEQPSQQTALLALAQQQGKRLIKLAADIVDYGVDPTRLPLVIATADQRKRYIVLEGNRRVTTLKGLETPSLILAAFDGPGQKRFTALSKRYAVNPIRDLNCVLFDSVEEADHWIDLAHTGQNEGAGLVEWGAEEKDRRATRHKKKSPASQVLEFVKKQGALSAKASASNIEIITTLTRLLSTPQVRVALGIDIRQGEVVQILPIDYVSKALTKVVDDLKTGELKVEQIYTKDDRVNYASNLTTELKPEDAEVLAVPTQLGDGAVSPPPKPKNGTASERTREIGPPSCPTHAS